MMTGCVEEFEADLPDDDTQLLVVDGTICSNLHNQFHLTWSSMIKNEIGHNGTVSFERPYEKPLPVNGAKVTICGTDGSVYECKEDIQTERTPKEGYYDPYSELYVYYDDEYGNVHFSEVEEFNEVRYSTGVYSCDVPELKPDVSYYLTIKYWDDVYQSTPEKPIRTPDIESLEYFQKDSLSDVEVLLTTDAPDDPDKTTFFTWDYSETWELRPSRTTRMYFDVGDYIYFDNRFITEYYKLLYPKYGWKTADSNGILIESTAHYAGGKLNRYQIVSIPRDDERISWNYSHKLTLRAISKDEYEYAMECRQAGWEMGGLFTPQPSVMPTNIRCLTSSKKVLGYVGCAQNIVTKRIYIDGTKVSRVLPESPVRILNECDESDCFKMIWDGWLLYSYTKSIDASTGEGKIGTHWVHAGDLDVRRRGADTVKPEYMPPFGEDYIFVDPGFNIYPKHDYYDEDNWNYEE